MFDDSFGESVKVVHSFAETFTSQSGADVLRQITFQQGSTNVTQVREINIIYLLSVLNSFTLITKSH